MLGSQPDPRPNAEKLNHPIGNAACQAATIPQNPDHSPIPVKTAVPPRPAAGLVHHAYSPARCDAGCAPAGR